MKTVPTTHPNLEQLAAFGLGRLNEAERLNVEQHVADCTSCCEALKTTPHDTLLRLAQAAAYGETRALAGDLTPPGLATPPLNLPPELAAHPRYRVLGLLGCGGMGAVYKAEHRIMERTVALKVINQEFLKGNKGAVDRFRQEVKAAGKLDHPNIVTAHDADQAGELHFLVMEYVDGVSLSRLVEKKGPVGVTHACHFIRQAALGLQHAFEKGMVHRDIKPHNLMLTRKGQVKILDFGLARFAREQAVNGGDPIGLPMPGDADGSDTARLTAPGLVLGTPDYIAPEQARDPRTADIRCDIYSLGCTLYFLLAGRPPFAEGGPFEKLVAHLQETPKPLDELRDDVSPDVAALVNQMMAKNPADRPQTPADVAKALASFLRSEPPAVTVEPSMPMPVPVPMPEPATKPRKAKRTLRKKERKSAPTAWWKPVIIAGIVGLVLAGGFLAAWMGWKALQPTGNLAGSTQPTTSPKTATSGQSPRILILVPSQGFFFPDYEPVERVLKQGGAELTITSTKTGLAKPSNGQITLPIDKDWKQVNVAEFDAVVLIGGEMREFSSDINGVRDFVGKVAAQQKPLGAICRGIKLITDSGFLTHKKKIAKAEQLAPWNNQIVEWVDEPVVQDGKIITAKNPEAAEKFAQAVLNASRANR